jgi:deoxyribonucleoside regulator
MNRKEDRNSFLSEVASLYYTQGVTQQEIAERFNCSRSAVSRFLSEARGLGIVEIIIHNPWATLAELEEPLRERFALKNARVLVGKDKSYEDVLQGLGVLGAEELEALLKPDSIIGISWGSALQRLVAAVHPRRMPAVEVVQMIGATGFGQGIGTDGPALAHRLADRLAGTYRHLHAPLVVESPQVLRALLADRNIKETLARAQRADIALVGIGSTTAGLYSILREGYITKQEAASARSQGAVGDICGQHFDRAGQVLDIDINSRTIGIALDKLKRIPAVMGIAGGVGKAEAILAALRGGYVNHLITDESAARWILSHAGS